MIQKVMICQYMNRKIGGKRQVYSHRLTKEISLAFQGNLQRAIPVKHKYGGKKAL